MSNVRGLRQKNFSRPLVPSAEKLQASNSSQLEAIRGGLLTYALEARLYRVILLVSDFDHSDWLKLLGKVAHFKCQICKEGPDL